MERLNFSRDNMAQRSNSFARLTTPANKCSGNKENSSFLGNMDRDMARVGGGGYRGSGVLKGIQKIKQFLPNCNKVMTPRKMVMGTPRKA